MYKSVLLFFGRVFKFEWKLYLLVCYIMFVIMLCIDLIDIAESWLLSFNDTRDTIR